MKRLLLPIVLLLSAALTFSQVPPPDPSHPKGPAGFIPLGAAGTPSNSPEFTIFTRDPVLDDSDTVNNLWARWTRYGDVAGSTGAWQSYFDDATINSLTGAQVDIAAWSSLGAGCSANPWNDNADPNVTADFSAKFTARFLPYNWILQSYPSAMVTWSPTFAGRHEASYNDDNTYISDIHSYTLRLYYVQPDALSVYAGRGRFEDSPPMHWHGAASATASVGRSLTVTDNGPGSMGPGVSQAYDWSPTYANFDTVPSNGANVKHLDVTLTRSTNPSYPGWWYFTANSIKFNGRTQTVHAQARMTTVKDPPVDPGGGIKGVGTGGGGLMVPMFDSLEPECQVPTGSIMPGGSYATGYAKERFLIFTIRCIAFNKAHVKGMVTFSDGSNPNTHDMTVTIKNASGTVLDTNQIGMDAGEAFEMPLLAGDGTYTVEVSTPGFTTVSQTVSASGSGEYDLGTLNFSTAPLLHLHSRRR